MNDDGEGVRQVSGAGWVHYMQKQTCVMEGEAARVDLVLLDDLSISRQHVKISSCPKEQASVIAVIGRNGIFVVGDFLRRGEAPRQIRSHTDIIIGRAPAMHLTFYLRKKDADSADKDDVPPADGPTKLTVVGQKLVAVHRSLDAEQLYNAVRATDLRMIRRSSPAVIRSFIRAAITANPHIFRIIPADKRHLDEQHTLAAFEVCEEHRLRFQRKPTATHFHARTPTKNSVRPAPNGSTR